VRAIIGRYFNNFSGRYLFFEGDWANPISTAPYQGVLLLADIIFLPLGLFTILKNKLQKGHYFFVLWLILAPLSSALSRDEINAVRDLNLAIPFVVIISFGIFQTIKWLNSQTFVLSKIIGFTLFVTFYAFSFLYFTDALFVHLPVHNSNYWRYGYREAVSYITPLESKYKAIVFEQSFNQPYIYFLFYQKYDAARYQKQANFINSQYKGDVGFEGKIDNIHFERVDWSVLRNAHNTLVFVSPGGTSPEAVNNPTIFKKIDEIKYRDNFNVAFNIFEIK